MQAFLLALPLLLLAGARDPACGGDLPAAPKPEVKASAPVPVLQHLAIVGASVSAGIGLDPTANPFAGEKSKLQLAQIVDASITGPHEVPHNGADFNFFSSPEAIAKRSAADAKAAKPTALVAIDFLFWMGYGPGGDEKREERVATGLKLLEAFTCPVLVGDLPDFRGAGTNPMYLPKESIPSAEALARINKRIYEWSKDRKNVVIVPMAEMLRKLIADEPFTVAGTTFEKGSKPRLLQADNLHTTLEGTCALWALAVEAWRKTDATMPADALLVDIPALVEKAQQPAAGATSGKVKAKKAKPAAKKEKAGAGAGG
ncbi:MAG: hypothetical protein NTY35_12535 [Planctomycetota bacterium]|nr:hypothetical protein [Planctomycetota bacterium]